MRIQYIPVVASRPILSRGGRFFHYRPITAVRLTGPSNSLLKDALLDTGSDETTFQESLAIDIGIDLSGAEERRINLIGRPAPVRCRYASVQLQITDGSHETYEWTVVVGFAATRLKYNLLGHGGFLQFFDADFRGAAHEVILIPNASFPGTQVVMPGRP